MTTPDALGAALPGNTHHTPGGALRRLPLPPSTPHRIASEAEALQAAQALADEWRVDAAARDHERRLPWQEIERHTASGLGAITVPRAYGGLGASYETLAQVFVTLCAADPSLGQIPQNHFAVLQNLRDMGSEPQKRRWFADVLAGHRLGMPGRNARGARPMCWRPRRACHAMPQAACASAARAFTPRARPSRTGCPSVPRTRRAASCRSGCGAMRQA